MANLKSCRVAGFLKDTLGLDLTGFLDWLGFLFDWDKIKETQQVRVLVSAFAVNPDNACSTSSASPRAC